MARVLHVCALNLHIWALNLYFVPALWAVCIWTHRVCLLLLNLHIPRLYFQIFIEQNWWSTLLIMNKVHLVSMHLVKIDLSWRSTLTIPLDCVIIRIIIDLRLVTQQTWRLLCLHWIDIHGLPQKKIVEVVPSIWFVLALYYLPEIRLWLYWGYHLVLHRTSGYNV